MKNKKIKISLIVIIIMMFLLVPQAYAKTSIEIKPNGNVYTNKTISEFFDESISMKNTGECLEGSNVDVHMATNLDWAIVSYFSNSAYGTNRAGQNNGTAITIDGKSGHYSTNGNITGIIDWGKTLTYTAGLREDYANITDDTIKQNISSLSISANNNRYIDIFPSRAWFDIKNIAAINKWPGNGYGVHTASQDAIVAHRAGLFGMQATSITQSTTDTFRPVITGN